MKRILSLLVLVAMAMSLPTTAFAAPPEPVTLDPPIEAPVVPTPWPAPPYTARLEDGVGDRQCLYLMENEDDKTAFLIAVIDYSAWTAYDQTGGKFHYDLDTGLISTRTRTDDGDSYDPVMYVVDGKAVGLEQMEGERTLTPSYTVAIENVTGADGKETYVRTVHYDGIEYVENDEISMDRLRAVQDGCRNAPGYGRLFPEDWSYEVRKAGGRGLSIDLAARRTVFFVEGSMDEFDAGELLGVLKASDRLRHVLLEKAERKAAR